MRSAILALFLMAVASPALMAQDFCIRFFGNGVNDIDRIKVPIDNPHRKADVAYDFTIEFRMKAVLAENPSGGQAVQGFNDDWTLGHVMVDRDVFGNGDYGDYGISLAGGKIAFGVNNGTDSYTLIGNTMVADGNWHSVAVTRNSTSGALRLFVDGISDKFIASTFATGNVSYRDGREITGNQWVNEPYIVLGAEKHDYDNQYYPSYSGYFDEFRISGIIRYSSSYTPPFRFTDDLNTLLLFHFDEGSGTVATDAALLSPGVPTAGTLKTGGIPSGPEWVFNGCAWNGSAGTAWDLPANWTPAAVPSASDPVLIPNVVNQPEIPAGMLLPAVCNDLYLRPGALLTIKPGKTLTVNGNLVVGLPAP